MKLLIMLTVNCVRLLVKCRRKIMNKRVLCWSVIISLSIVRDRMAFKHQYVVFYLLWQINWKTILCWNTHTHVFVRCDRHVLQHFSLQYCYLEYKEFLRIFHETTFHKNLSIQSYICTPFNVKWIFLIGKYNNHY